MQFLGLRPARVAIEAYQTVSEFVARAPGVAFEEATLARLDLGAGVRWSTSFRVETDAGGHAAGVRFLGGLPHVDAADRLLLELVGPLTVLEESDPLTMRALGVLLGPLGPAAAAKPWREGLLACAAMPDGALCRRAVAEAMERARPGGGRVLLPVRAAVLARGVKLAGTAGELAAAAPSILASAGSADAAPGDRPFPHWVPHGCFDAPERIAKEGPSPDMTVRGTVESIRQETCDLRALLRLHAPDHDWGPSVGSFLRLRVRTEGGLGIDVICHADDLAGTAEVGAALEAEGHLSVRFDGAEIAENENLDAEPPKEEGPTRGVGWWQASPGAALRAFLLVPRGAGEARPGLRSGAEAGESDGNQGSASRGTPQPAAASPGVAPDGLAGLRLPVLMVFAGLGSLCLLGLPGPLVLLWQVWVLRRRRPRLSGAGRFLIAIGILLSAASTLFALLFLAAWAGLIQPPAPPPPPPGYPTPAGVGRHS